MERDLQVKGNIQGITGQDLKLQTQTVGKDIVLESQGDVIVSIPNSAFTLDAAAPTTNMMDFETIPNVAPAQGNLMIGPGAVALNTADDPRVQIIGDIALAEGIHAGPPRTLMPPGPHRVWTTRKVFNVLDYGATPLQSRGSAGDEAVITQATSRIAQTGQFAGVRVGDSLRVLNGANAGCYRVGAVISADEVEIDTRHPLPSFSANQNNVRWEIPRAGFNGTINQATAPNRLVEIGAFTGVQVGDTLWVNNGENIGFYEITVVNGVDSVNVAAPGLGIDQINVIWKVTSGSPGNADSTEEFQAAINSAIGAGGGVVFVPAGYYLFAGHLTMGSAVTIMGESTSRKGWHQSKWTGTPNPSPLDTVWAAGTPQGSVLIPTETAANPFIDMRFKGAALYGLGIQYVAQREPLVPVQGTGVCVFTNGGNVTQVTNWDSFDDTMRIQGPDGQFYDCGGSNNTNGGTVLITGGYGGATTQSGWGFVGYTPYDPIPYPTTIVAGGINQFIDLHNADNAIVNIVIGGAFDAIELDPAGACGRFQLIDSVVCALHRGILLDNCLQGFTIRNVTFSQSDMNVGPTAGQGSVYMTYRVQHLIAIEIRRADAYLIDNVGCISSLVGILLDQAASGTSYGNISKLVGDFCATTLQVNQVSGSHPTKISDSSAVATSVGFTRGVNGTITAATNRLFQAGLFPNSTAAWPNRKLWIRNGQNQGFYRVNQWISDNEIEVDPIPGFTADETNVVWLVPNELDPYEGIFSSTGIVANSSNQGSLLAANMEFGGLDATGYVEWSCLDVNSLHLSNCQFYHYDNVGNDFDAIRIASGRALIVGCRFTGFFGSGRHAIHAESGTKVIASGNDLDGNSVGGNGNIYAEEIPDTFLVDSRNGRVGIGTTGPNYNLSVAGVIEAQGTGYSGDLIRLGNDAKLRDVDVANTVALYGLQNSDRATLRLGENGGEMSGKDGFLGIGTTAPKSDLEVNGAVGVKVVTKDDNDSPYTARCLI